MRYAASTLRTASTVARFSDSILEGDGACNSCGVLQGARLCVSEQVVQVRQRI